MYEYRCKIVKVIDGDTVDVDIDLGFDVILKNQRVRLHGVDTPESRTRDLVEKKFGLAAKAFVEEFLNCEDIKLLTKQYDAKGKFGRILGDFSVPGKATTLCSALIELHHAAPYFGQSKEEIEEIHLANREILISEGKVNV